MGKEAPDIILQIVVVSVFAVLFAGFLFWFKASSKAILRKWAKENGFQIVKSRQGSFFTGRFKWWTNGRMQDIYFVKVRDQDGHERSGWVRCGSFFGGVLFSNQIEVRWDEP
jgi:hypothetical protein